MLPDTIAWNSFIQLRSGNRVTSLASNGIRIVQVSFFLWILSCDENRMLSNRIKEAKWNVTFYVVELKHWLELKKYINFTFLCTKWQTSTRITGNTSSHKCAENLKLPFAPDWASSIPTHSLPAQALLHTVFLSFVAYLYYVLVGKYIGYLWWSKIAITFITRYR